jgi:hypothetical protein
MAQQQQKILPRPVDWDELYPGRFLKAVDFKGKQVTLKISEVKIEELVGDKGPQIKGVISFDKTEKQWALNKTNGICLKEMFGKKVQEWVGKRVTLFPSQWDGEDCIRVWGSPEIDADRAVTIALPRKRPFQMIMHRTGVAVAKSTATASPKTTGEPPSDTKSIEQLRSVEQLESFERVKNSVWAVYAAAGVEVPREVEAAANDRRELLEQQSAEEAPDL